VALVAAPALASAQTPDAGPQAWLAWTGCWTEVGAPIDAPMTCIVPDGDAVELLTVSSAGIAERQPLRADGVERPVTVDGCTGVRAASASAEGARVYTRSTLRCDGGIERTTRGLMAMVSPDEWIQVRALTAGEGSVSWVQRYRAAPTYRVAAAGLPELTTPSPERTRAVEAARIAASRAPTVDDVIEASGRTDPEAVRAWIAEQGSPLRLDADRLLRMADAGVPEDVIDVVVAVTHPERFAIALDPGARQGEDRYMRDDYGYTRGGMGLWPHGDPLYYTSPFYPYSMWSTRTAYGYTPLGFGPRGYYRPFVVVVRPSGDFDDRVSGRAVKGRGYTRPAGTSGSGVRPARPSSATSGGYVSGSGSSSSSSSKSKGKAKPRGGG
jgi:hypothetical protein